MADRPPLTLQAYRLLTAMAMPAAGVLLNQRLKRGKEIEARLAERRGEGAIPRPEGPLVWVHVASVGEMLSVLPLIERIRARDIAVLVTSGTVTAAELAERRFPPGVIHQFVPVDMPQFVARFLDHWRPNLGAVRRVRPMAEPDHGGGAARRSADPGERPAVGALVQALAEIAAHHRCAARQL